MPAKSNYEELSPGSNLYAEEEFTTGNQVAIDSTAVDNLDSGFDLQKHLIGDKARTFYFRMNSDAMTGAGIFSGDILVVDRSAKAVNGKIVVAQLNGELLVRRLEKTFNRIRLLPETQKLSPIDIDPSGAEFSIWAVVLYTIHAVS